VGFTLRDEPVPAGVPPQLPLYHTQLAPAPRLPPCTLTVLLEPLHIVLTVAVAPVGAVDAALTVTVTEPQAVVVGHGAGPSALTK
jgi:hypothetical protein